MPISPPEKQVIYTGTADTIGVSIILVEFDSHGVEDIREVSLYAPIIQWTDVCVTEQGCGSWRSHLGSDSLCLGTFPGKLNKEGYSF